MSVLIKNFLLLKIFWGILVPDEKVGLQRRRFKRKVTVCIEEHCIFYFFLIKPGLLGIFLFPASFFFFSFCYLGLSVALEADLISLVELDLNLQLNCLCAIGYCEHRK